MAELRQKKTPAVATAGAFYVRAASPGYTGLRPLITRSRMAMMAITNRM